MSGRLANWDDRVRQKFSKEEARVDALADGAEHVVSEAFARGSIALRCEIAAEGISFELLMFLLRLGYTYSGTGFIVVPASRGAAPSTECLLGLELFGGIPNTLSGQQFARRFGKG